jgi:F0F1-type ATP synthase epsilon subunit
MIAVSDGTAQVRLRACSVTTPSAHEENSMSKQKAKKEPQKTLKEKRKEKKDKKSGKGVLSL